MPRIPIKFVYYVLPVTHQPCVCAWWCNVQSNYLARVSPRIGCSRSTQRGRRGNAAHCGAHRRASSKRSTVVAVSFDEYMACVQGIVSALKDEMEGGKGPEDKMRDAFKTFDADGSGYLEREEFKRVLTQMGKDRLTEEQFEALMQDVDTDEDGRVNVEEFIAMSTKGMTWLKG